MAYPTCTFVKGGVTLTLPAPSPGSQIVTTRHQTTSRTASGVAVIYDHAVTFYEAALTFDGLTATEKANLESFLATAAGASFTYTDSAGNAFTAYLLDTALKFTSSIRGQYNVSLRLDLSAAGV